MNRTVPIGCTRSLSSPWTIAWSLALLALVAGCSGYTPGDGADANQQADATESQAAAEAKPPIAPPAPEIPPAADASEKPPQDQPAQSEPEAPIEEPPSTAEAKPSPPLSDDVATWEANDFERAIAERNPKFTDAVKHLGDRSAGSDREGAELAQLLALVAQMPDDGSTTRRVSSSRSSARSSSGVVVRPSSRSRGRAVDPSDPSSFQTPSFDPDHFRASSMKDISDVKARHSMDRLKSKYGRGY